MLHNEKIKATVQSSVGSKYGDYIPGYYETHNTEGWVKDALESEVDYCAAVSRYCWMLLLAAEKLLLFMRCWSKGLWKKARIFS